jgi:predicted RNA binding protein YcfA (HicA-like mRNA interferase family)
VKLPRDLAGATLASALCRTFGYEKVHQTGSHIVLQALKPSRHRISIPAHPVLRVGTLDGILRSVARARAMEKSEVLEALLG